jgi:hypothetical protein
MKAVLSRTATRPPLREMTLQPTPAQRVATFLTDVGLLTIALVVAYGGLVSKLVFGDSYLTYVHWSVWVMCAAPVVPLGSVAASSLRAHCVSKREMSAWKVEHPVPSRPFRK